MNVADAAAACAATAAAAATASIVVAATAAAVAVAAGVAAVFTNTVDNHSAISAAGSSMTVEISHAGLM